MVRVGNPVQVPPSRRRVSAQSFGVASPPFDPSTIAGLKLWLKADSLTLNDNDAVATWADSSGNGNNAVQGTGSVQPTLQTNELNGLPVVRFDGTDWVAANFAGGTLSQPNTIFIVAKTTAGTGVGNVFLDTNTAASPRNICYTQPNDFYSMYAGTAQIGSVVKDTSFHIFGHVFNGASSKIWVGGGTAVTGNAGAEALTTGYRIGADMSLTAGTMLTGDMFEVLVWNALLTDPQLNLVGNYLERSGLTWTDV